MKNSVVFLKQNNGLCFYTAIDEWVFVLDSENGQCYWFNETASQLENQSGLTPLISERSWCCGGHL